MASRPSMCPLTLGVVIVVILVTVGNDRTEAIL